MDMLHTQVTDTLRVWQDLMKCCKRLEQEMSDRFRHTYNMSFSRFDVLANLHHAGESGMCTSQLGRRLLASKGNITRLLDRMEADELIIRKSCDTDRRVSKVYLSQAGAELFTGMVSRHETWCGELFSHLSEQDKERLISLLEVVNGEIN